MLNRIKRLRKYYLDNQRVGKLGVDIEIIPQMLDDMLEGLEAEAGDERGLIAMYAFAGTMTIEELSKELGL